MLSADAQIWCFDQNSVWKIIPSNNSSRFSHLNPDNSDRFFLPYKGGAAELGHGRHPTEVSARGRKEEGCQSHRQQSAWSGIEYLTGLLILNDMRNKCERITPREVLGFVNPSW